MSSKYPLLDDKEWLFHQYRVEKLSMSAIGRLVGCDHHTVSKALIYLNIPRLTKTNLRDKQWLEEKYLREKLTLFEVAKIIGCSGTTVFRALKRCNIPRRSKRETTKGEKNPMFGKHHTEEAKKKISGARTGGKPSEETRRKIGDAQKGENHWNFGKHHSEETRQKMSEAHKGQVAWNKGKHCSEETKRKISKANTNPSEETRKKISEARKNQTFPTHHTRPELIFIGFYRLFGIAERVEDTSNNGFHIGRLNPDFIIRDMRIAIFINGDYWHSGLLKYDLGYTQRPENQIKTCKRHKWKAVIIWESDLLREDAEAFVLHTLREEGIIK